MAPAADEFTFQPLPPIEGPASAASHAERLGPLAGLRGRWVRGGFNMSSGAPARCRISQSRDDFLELNMTAEELDFGPTLGLSSTGGCWNPHQPGRDEVRAAGVRHNLSAAQHFEPGLWVHVPRTGDPQEPPTVARMASIPHGTTILAQGTASTSPGPPTFPPVSIAPFPIGQPDQPTGLRGAAPGPAHAAPDRRGGAARCHPGHCWDNPNSVLAHAPLIAGEDIETTTTLKVFTSDPAIPGGGTANIAFLTGAGLGPNAHATHVSATFWLRLQGQLY